MDESTSKRILVGSIAFILAINLTMITVGAKYDDPVLCKGQVTVKSTLAKYFSIRGRSQTTFTRGGG